MTISEAISKLNYIKPNQYSQSQKVQWLSAIDGRIYRGILLHYENAPEEFTGYNDETPTDTQLLVTEPFEALYEYWLQAQVDYSNREFASYNNSMAMFNQALSDFRNDYNQTHKHKQTVIKTI